jgi:hypothetical protein
MPFRRQSTKFKIRFSQRLQRCERGSLVPRVLASSNLGLKLVNAYGVSTNHLLDQPVSRKRLDVHKKLECAGLLNAEQEVDRDR